MKLITTIDEPLNVPTTGVAPGEAKRAVIGNFKSVPRNQGANVPQDMNTSQGECPSDDELFASFSSEELASVIPRADQLGLFKTTLKKESSLEKGLEFNVEPVKRLDDIAAKFHWFADADSACFSQEPPDGLWTSEPHFIPERAIDLRQIQCDFNIFRSRFETLENSYQELSVRLETEAKHFEARLENVEHRLDRKRHNDHTLMRGLLNSIWNLFTGKTSPLASGFFNLTILIGASYLMAGWTTRHLVEKGDQRIHILDADHSGSNFHAPAKKPGMNGVSTKPDFQNLSTTETAQTLALLLDNYLAKVKSEPYSSAPALTDKVLLQKIEAFSAVQRQATVLPELQAQPKGPRLILTSDPSSRSGMRRGRFHAIRLGHDTGFSGSAVKKAAEITAVSFRPTVGREATVIGIGNDNSQWPKASLRATSSRSDKVNLLASLSDVSRLPKSANSSIPGAASSELKEISLPRFEASSRTDIETLPADHWAYPALRAVNADDPAFTAKPRTRAEFAVAIARLDALQTQVAEEPLLVALKHEFQPELNQLEGNASHLQSVPSVTASSQIALVETGWKQGTENELDREADRAVEVLLHGATGMVLVPGIDSDLAIAKSDGNGFVYSIVSANNPNQRFYGSAVFDRPLMLGAPLPESARFIVPATASSQADVSIPLSVNGLLRRVPLDLRYSRASNVDEKTDAGKNSGFVFLTEPDHLAKESLARMTAMDPVPHSTDPSVRFVSVDTKVDR